MTSGNETAPGAGYAASTTTAPPVFLTVKELAALLRVTERKVYDLAATGRVPCTRATGRLLFPRTEIEAWIERAGDSGAGARAPTPRPAIVLGSHDPLFDWALRQSRCGLATYFDGSHDGLERFAARGGVAAGLHLFDPGSGSWNVPAVTARCAGSNCVLVRFARRSRGLVLAPGATGITGLADLAGRSVVPRQPEAGAQTLFRQLAQRAGLRGADVNFVAEARSESDAVQTVARGTGEATLGLASLAQLFGLRFVPLLEEPYDLLVDRAAWFDGPWQTFHAFLRGPAFADAAREMGGYDLSDAGAVIWNG